MKMLYILNTTNRVNNFSYSSMIAAQELGIEFHIAGNWTGYNNLADKSADEKKYGIRIHQIDFIRTPYDPRNIKAYRQVVELIKREQFDVIHCNTPIGGVIGRLAGKRCRVKKIIYEAHGFHFFKGAPMINWMIYYPIEKWLAHYTDYLITINKEDFKQAKGFHLKTNGVVCYVPGVGIDLQEYSDIQQYRDAKRNELGIQNEDIVIISVGELNANKNNGVIISALAKLKNPHIQYCICGVGENKEKLQVLARKLGIEKNVHFLGFRSDIKELYSASDIFVLPSFREGLSRSIMEAMAAGLPCIVSRIRGNVDLISNKKMLCDPNSIDNFAKAIYDLAASKSKREETGKQNSVNIHCYSLEEVVALMVSIYNNAIKW